MSLELVEKALSQNDKIEKILKYKPILLQSDKVKIQNHHFKKLA